ncbi:MAG: 4Fe-4S dicluster domain-containing protein [Candidatus Lokiarchaeota archaeon]|nr:4Fe-4S dicluster domain-containing protein [Candidatus Lokiarchaeota archaeon]
MGDFTIKIDMDACTGCGECYNNCGFDVYDEPEGGKANIVDEDACTGCRSCESQCPEEAIEIIEND